MPMRLRHISNPTTCWLPCVKPSYCIAQDKGRVFPVIREKLSTGGVFGIKAGDVQSEGLLGFKAAGFWPSNRARGSEPHLATIMLVDPVTGRPVCIIDGNAITTTRTGAAGAVGLQQLARRDSTQLCVFGIGVQARAQVGYALRVLPHLQHLRYVSVDRKRDEAFENCFAGRVTVECAVNADAAVARSDVIITATPGGGPLFNAEAVRPGTHLNCVGADTKGKRELPEGLLARVRLVHEKARTGAQRYRDPLALVKHRSHARRPPSANSYGEKSMNDQKTSNGIRYRAMTSADMPAVHKLSSAVLWPHRLQDWKFVHELGTGIVAEDDSGVIGIAMCFAHGSDHASLGMLIVSPERQHQSIGRELVSRVLKEVGDRTVLLHATLEGVPLCESLGFTRIGTVHQHQGTVYRVPVAPLGEGERIRPVSARDDAALVELASRASGFPRRTALKHLLNVADCAAIDLYDELIGFAALRKYGLGYAIGPVVAPDIGRAKALIAHWAGTYAGSFVRVDVLGKHGLSPWLTKMGMVQVEKTVPTMVRGEPPRPDPAITQYALLNQALG
jgi:ornithine cyclodeaminase/alanine dehydrogenase-like protein (mu-crystallin family)/predicted N-acetyltransferase YhbS